MLKPIAALFLCLPGLLSAQVIAGQSFAFPADLKQYLSLTGREVAAIQEATARYNQWAASKQLRLLAVQDEIAAETRKPQPDALTLGVEYAEIESIRRALSAHSAALRGQLQASLDKTQRGKLNSLDEARNLLPLAYDAQCENLIDPSDAGFTSTGCSFTLFPPELSQYLALSIGQADALTTLNLSNRKESVERERSMTQLRARTALETANDSPDPLALGKLDVQIETTRRGIANGLVTLRNKARALLNDAQREKLSSLEDARKLQSSITMAECENLIEPRSHGNPPSCGLTGLFVPTAVPATR